MVVILVGIVIFQNCSGNPFIERIDNTLPNIAEAPFQIITKTHLYYAEKAEMNPDESVTMVNWYENTGGKWIKHDESITLPAVMRPRINKREVL